MISNPQINHIIMQLLTFPTAKNDPGYKSIPDRFQKVLIGIAVCDFHIDRDDQCRKRTAVFHVPYGNIGKAVHI